MLVETVLQDPQAELVGVLVRAGSALEGQDAGAFIGRDTGVRVSSDPEQVLAGAPSWREADYRHHGVQRNAAG